METGSLWSQLLSEAVTGPLAGKTLKVLSADNTTWGDWQTVHPDTRVLSFTTGYDRDYRLDPYASYPFPRSPALLVMVGSSVKIYPFSVLKKFKGSLSDRVGDQELTILYDRKTQTAWIENQPAGVIAYVAFINDLKAFYPHTEYIGGRIVKAG